MKEIETLALRSWILLLPKKESTSISVPGEGNPNSSSKKLDIPIVEREKHVDFFSD